MLTFSVAKLRSHCFHDSILPSRRESLHYRAARLSEAVFGPKGLRGHSDGICGLRLLQPDSPVESGARGKRREVKGLWRSFIVHERCLSFTRHVATTHSHPPHRPPSPPPSPSNRIKLNPLSRVDWDVCTSCSTMQHRPPLRW